MCGCRVGVSGVDAVSSLVLGDGVPDQRKLVLRGDADEWQPKAGQIDFGAFDVICGAFVAVS